MRFQGIKSRFIRVACVSIGLALASVAWAGPELYFPATEGSWESIAANEAGLDSAAVEAALAFAGERNSSGVVILYKGRIVAERYWPMDDAGARYKRMVAGTTSGGHSIEDVASAQKSVVSFLVALARERGHFKLTDAVSDHIEGGWSKAHRDRESAITIRHLISMTSGLKSDLSFQANAGTVWRYNTNAYAKTVAVLEASTGRDIQTLTREWLTKPVGMRDTQWAPRPWVTGGADANTIGLATSARDLARFGLLVLADGVWGGKKLLNDPKYLHESLQSSQALNMSYGYLWWLNGKESYRRAAGQKLTRGSLNPAAPDDLVAAQGALGRKCYIVPSRQLVVTRLGDDPGGAFDREFWAKLLP